MSELEPFAIKLSSLRKSNMGYSENDLFIAVKVADNHMKSYIDANKALLEEREKWAKELEQTRNELEQLKKKATR